MFKNGNNAQVMIVHIVVSVLEGKLVLPSKLKVGTPY